ncbi:MAG: hypothetical protein HYR97_03595 [Candidatus Melainabacteria bacterium]|nr:hypothetical protein [Candidatus Melainabacteria bacterium]MBI3308929.1 hypothetical protein [Candidatus Melainabacteria bacterium]
MLFFPLFVTLPPDNTYPVSCQESNYQNEQSTGNFGNLSFRLIFSKPDSKIKIKETYKDYSIGQDPDINSKIRSIKELKKGENLELEYFINSFTEKAFSQNIASFPISDIKKILDPKTNEVPKILIPKDTKEDEAVTNKLAQVEYLPNVSKDEDGIKRITSHVSPNAIIWLPKPYLIAGSFHTETYPHDTSFTLWGILELIKTSSIKDKTKFIDIVKDQLENFIFQINTLGFPLNGNRGYFITRSQTNIIPSNVLEFYKATNDKKWLEEKGVLLAESIFNYWTNKIAEIKTKGEVGYRWIAHGNGPCSEVLDSHGAHNFYYFKVLKVLAEYLFIHDLEKPDFAKGFNYTRVIEAMPEDKIEASKLKKAKEYTDNNDKNSEFFYYENEPIIKLMGSYYRLTSFYYLNDRASRVSGYDTNHLYGPFNSFTYDFIPVDHNLILYKSANDLSEMFHITENKDKAKEYAKKANELKKMILKVLWSENQKMFFEYDSKTKTNRTGYPFASAGYAFWAHFFDINKKSEKDMLIEMVKYMEKNLEGPLGFYASGIETGLHWDKPYTWPIQQGYIIGGLRAYAKELQDKQDFEHSRYLANVADRISLKYLLANYSDWLKNQGKEIGEKVIQGKENLLTGYATGSNYTWNLIAVMYLYNNLSEEAKRFLYLSLREDKIPTKKL